MTPSAPLPGRPARCRTLFVSDIHLGTRGCQADMFLDFLGHVQADRIYLVGDIFDGWRLKRGWHWPQPHNNVIEALLARAHQGVPVIYVPGNHDELMRRYLGTHFGGIEVRDEDTHVTADGRRLLVVHGDKFDVVVMNAKWLAHIGDWAYTVTLLANTWYNRLRRLWGGQYWSLSNWAKQSVKRAVNFIGDFEKVLAEEARRGGYDGIVCGHIHKAELTPLGDVLYANCGDWVESCTGIIEDHDGRLQLVDWACAVREHAREARDGGRKARKKKKPKKAKAAI
ncbi:UDP-2,3-diacylglucosamine diphosphatase [Mangrovicoccus ximenensis]|uniref:UDP-2,3-diacylglucosamine diphosphatase n=1 Tax=Mangrovicoccus ximenensis TaxID=1911570 RepID=UPI000D35CDD9|nr:UDP-2,3-diacylglucosamine diphosphatase [Mangrovicoccus ximenensis]